MKRLELAAKLGVHPRTIDRFVEEGMPVLRRGRGGRASCYSLAAVRRWLAERDRAVVTGVGETTRQRRDRFKGELARLNFEAMSRKYVPADEAARAWAAESAAIGRRIREWGRALGGPLFAAAETGGASGVEQLLTAEVHALLSELADVEPLEGEKNDDRDRAVRSVGGLSARSPARRWTRPRPR